MHTIRTKQHYNCITLQSLLDGFSTPAILTLAEGGYVNRAYMQAFAGNINNGRRLPELPQDMLIEIDAAGVTPEEFPAEITLPLYNGCGLPRWISFRRTELMGITFYNGFETTPLQTEFDLVKSSEDRLSEFFNNIGEAIFIVENHYPDFPVVSVNDSFLHYFNILMPDILGVDVCGLVFPEMREQLFTYLFQVCTVNKPVTFETVVRPDGVARYFSVHLNCKGYNANSGEVIIGTVSDITESRRAAFELEETRQKAEVFGNLKASFLANLSHEIRTPLNGINGFAQILGEELEDEWYKSVVKRILASSGRLLSTLNALIDLSRLEAENLVPNKSQLDIIDFLYAVLPEYKERITAKGLAFSAELPDKAIAIESDSYLLRSILDKIIDNAVKYTAHGGVTITLRTDSRYVYIDVTDTGIGIETKDQGIIFEEFWQVTAGMERAHEGLGIGLTLAKKMLHLMKGEILVSSTPGEGSTFTVKYPVWCG